MARTKSNSGGFDIKQTFKVVVTIFLFTLLVTLFSTLTTASNWDGNITALTFALRLDNNATDFGLYGNNFTNGTQIVFQTKSFKTSTGAMNITGTTDKLTAVNSNVCQANTDCFYNWWFNRNQNSLTDGVMSYDAANWLDMQRTGSGVPNAQRLFLNSVNVLTTPAGFTLDTWYMETLVRYSNGNISFYINNTVVATGTYTGQIGGSGTKLLIGDDSNGDNGNGELFDQFYFSNNTVPNASTVSALWSSGQATNCPLNGTCFPPTLIAPILTNIQNTSITNFSASISFNVTNAAGNYSIFFYNSSNIVTQYTTTSFITTGANVTIMGLSPFTPYFYNITTCAASGACNTYGQYNFTTLNTNVTLLFNVFDDFNKSRIGGMNVNFSNSNKYNIVSTSSSTDTIFYVPAGIYNITVQGNPHYIPLYSYSFNITNGTSPSINFSDYGITINYNASTLISKMALPFNLSIQSYGYNANYTIPTNLTVYMPFNVTATQNLTSNAYFPIYSQSLSTLINQTFNSIIYYTGNFSDNNITFTVRDYLSNGTVSAFNISIYEPTTGFALNNINTSSTNLSIMLQQLYTYTVTASSTGYGTSTTYIKGNATYQNYTFFLLATNQSGAIINIYDETTGLKLSQVTPINTTAYVNFISPQYSGNVSVYNEVTVNNLLAGGYEIRYGAQGYNERSYYFQLNNGTTINLNLYLLNSSQSSFIPLNVQDKNGVSLVNATVKVLRYYLSGNSYVIVTMTRTDASGQSTLDLVPNTVQYQYIIDYQGRTILISNPQKITGSQLAFSADLGTSPLTGYYQSQNIGTSLNFSNTSLTLTYIWNDQNNVAQGGHLRVLQRTLQFGDTILCDNIINTSSGVINCIIPNATSTYIASGFIRTNNTYNEFITNEFILPYFASGTLPKDIWGVNGVFMVFIFLCVTVFLGIANPIIGVVFAIISLVFFSLLGVITIGTTVLTGLILFAIIALFVGFKKT